MFDDDYDKGVRDMEEALRRLEKHEQEIRALVRKAHHHADIVKDAEVRPQSPEQVKNQTVQDGPIEAPVADVKPPVKLSEVPVPAPAAKVEIKPAAVPEQDFKPPAREIKKEEEEPPEVKPQAKSANRVNPSRFKKVVLFSLGMIAVGSVCVFAYNNGVYRSLQARWYLHKLEADPSGSAKEKLLKIGAEAIPVLVKALESSDNNTRSNAAYFIRDMGPAARTAVPALIKALGVEGGGTRYHAAIAISGIGPDAKDAVPELVKMLNGKLTGLRDLAITALGNIGADSKEAVPALTGLLKGTDPYLIVSVAECLGKIGPAAKEAGPALMSILKDSSPMMAEDPNMDFQKKKSVSDRRPQVQFAALKALNGIGFHSAEDVGVLVKLKSNNDFHIRYEAGQMLSDLVRGVEQFAVNTMKTSAAMNYQASWVAMSNKMKSTFVSYAMYERMRMQQDGRAYARAGAAAITTDVRAEYVGVNAGRIKVKLVFGNALKTCVFYYYVVLEEGKWRLDDEEPLGCSYK